MTTERTEIDSWFIYGELLKACMSTKMDMQAISTWQAKLSKN